MKLKCQERHNQLLASQAYQEFNRDADEVSNCRSVVISLMSNYPNVVKLIVS